MPRDSTGLDGTLQADRRPNERRLKPDTNIERIGARTRAGRRFNALVLD
jgi:hypothetical protein